MVTTEKIFSATPAIRVPRDGTKLVIKSRRKRSPVIFTSQVKGFAKSRFREQGQDLDKFLRAVVNACASNVAVLDQSGTILYASKAWPTSLSSCQESPLPHYFEECKRFTGPSTGENAEATLSDDIQGILDGKEKEFHRKYFHPGLGRPRNFVTHVVRLNLPGSAFRVLVSLDDIVFVREPLRKSEARVSKRTEEALQAVGGRLIAAQEEERRRVARELHDDLNQRMALLSIELEQLAEETQTPLLMRERLRKVQEQAREISADIQRISYKLHPSKLDHLGLAAAVKSLCKELSESRTIRIDFKESGFPATLPKDVTLCAFRIVQEALRNCVKHSDAQTVQVLLEKTNHAVQLSVSDDGCGFDVESDATKKGLGFISMRERVHLVNGAIQIHSQPRRGTCIKVSIPVVSDSN